VTPSGESPPADADAPQRVAGQSAPANRGRMMRRLLGAALLVGCGSVLGVAAWLRPDARGFGTHEQLGAGRCGMLVMTGYPCPSCGMTTSFAHTVRGQWLRAMWAQPGGFVLALVTIALAVGGAFMLAAGRAPPVNYVVITPYRFFAGLLVVLLGGWGLKVLIGLVAGTLPLRH
jgi:hypothetical protein